MSELIEVRDGKTISAATAETLKQVQALHSAASSAIDGLLSLDDADDADGDGDDQAEADDDGTQSPIDPNSALDAAVPRSAETLLAIRATRAVLGTNPVAVPAVTTRAFVHGGEQR
jgi:hypothetical protein